MLRIVFVKQIVEREVTLETVLRVNAICLEVFLIIQNNNYSTDSLLAEYFPSRRIEKPDFLVLEYKILMPITGDFIGWSVVRHPAYFSLIVSINLI